MSSYIIYGKNEYLEMQQRKRILAEERIQPDQIVEIDGSDKKKFRFESVLIECNTISLFEDMGKKAVIVTNPWFLKASTGKEESGKDDKRAGLLQQMESYLKAENPDVCFLFYLIGSELDTRKKEAKLLEKYHVKKVHCDLIKPWEFGSHITEVLKKEKLELTPAARKEFDLRIGTDEFQLHHAIEKMHLYGEKKFDVDVIKQLIPEDVNLDIWKLGNAFLQGNLAEAIHCKDTMMEKGMEVMDILPLFSSQLKRAYNIMCLYDLHYDQAAIATRLHMKDTAVKMQLQTMRNQTSKRILKMLVGLAEVDQDIKRGFVEPGNAFDMYLLKYGK